MTIKRITNTSLEANKVILRPRVTYTVSGSDITGSMPLIPNPSPNIHVLSEVTPDSGLFDETSIDVTSFVNNLREKAQEVGAHDTLIISSYLNEIVPSSSLPSKNSKDFQIKIVNLYSWKFCYR